MTGKMWRRVVSGGILFVTLAGCGSPGGGESALPASPTPTGEPAGSLELAPTQTPTVVPVGGTGDSTPEPTPPPLCPNLELAVEFQQVQTLQMSDLSIENTIQAAGTVPLSVVLQASPPTLSGEAELPVTGGGHTNDCVFENSGSLVYQLEGEILPGPEGLLEVHLGGQRSMNIVSTPFCGGMGAAPLEDLGEVVMAYADGETAAWDWDVPSGGVQGSAQWVLHIPCQE